MPTFQPVDSAGPSEPQVAVSRETWAERMAVGLGLASDPREAASKVGLPEGLSDEELKELAERARVYHTDLIEGRASAVARQIHTALALASLRAREQAAVLGPGVVATAIKSLVQASEALTGGAQRVYSNITIGVPKDHA